MEYYTWVPNFSHYGYDMLDGNFFFINQDFMYIIQNIKNKKSLLMWLKFKNLNV